MKLPAFVMRALRRRLLSLPIRRDPDFVIGGVNDRYLRRWWVIPRNPVFNVYLHEFCRDDDDRALHDHPWLFNASILLEGDYMEHLPPRRGLGTAKCEWRLAGHLYLRFGPAPHRVQLFRDLDARPIRTWTVFITGPRYREWGFLCPKGWRNWRDFCGVTPDGRNDGNVGRGCD